jgi:hypothetical protein
VRGSFQSLSIAISHPVKLTVYAYKGKQTSEFKAILDWLISNGRLAFFFFLSFLLFCLFVCFETGFLCVALVVLELTL